MSGTYRRMLMHVYDGLPFYAHGTNARKARAKNKDIDRRIKRREHARMTRDATHSFYADGADTLYDYLDDEDYSYADDFNQWCNDHHEELYDDYDLQLQHEDIHQYYYDDDYSDFPDPFWDHEYNPSPYSYRREEDPHDRIIKPEDAGKSLGDLLQEIMDRKANAGKHY